MEREKNDEKKNKNKKRQHLTGISVCFFFGRVRHIDSERHVYVVWHLSILNFFAKCIFCAIKILLLVFGLVYTT